MTQDATDAALLFENDNDIEITGSSISSRPVRLKLASAKPKSFDIDR
jgi:hypothetical protein